MSSATAQASFETAMDAAVTAIDGGDYVTARQKIVVAQIHFRKIPTDTQKGEYRLRWTETDMAALLAQIGKLEAASLPATSSVVHFSMNDYMG